MIAQRFALVGLRAFGGSPSQVALLKSQPWREGMLDDAAFSSLDALVQALPGFSAAQLVAAIGLIQTGSPQGGLAALTAYSLGGTLLLGAIGWLGFHGAAHHPFSTVSPILASAQMGLAASAVALAAKAAMQLAHSLVEAPSAAAASAADRNGIGLARFICVAAAALTVCFPRTPAVLPAVLAAAGAITGGHTWWVTRRRRGGATSTAAAEEEEVATRLGGSGAAEEESVSGDGAAAATTTSAERLEALREGRDPDAIATAPVPLSRRSGVTLVGAWFTLLLLLLLVFRWTADEPPPLALRLVEVCFRCGSMVWGGGAVMLPILLREVAPVDVAPATFLQGAALVHVARPLGVQPRRLPRRCVRRPARRARRGRRHPPAGRAPRLCRPAVLEGAPRVCRPA